MRALVRPGLLGLGWVLCLLPSPSALADPGALPQREQITLYAMQNLDFGRVATGRLPGSVSLDAQSRTAQHAGLDRVGQREQLGHILLRGEPGAEFRIFLNPEMVFDGPLPGALRGQLLAAPRFEGRFDAAGQAEIHLGGLLSLPPGLVGGVYRARFELRVEYR